MSSQNEASCDPGADQLDGGRGPELVHAWAAPDVHALLVGLQPGHRLDAAAAEVGVEVGQVADRADVRGLVEHGDQGWVDPPAAGVAA